MAACPTCRFATPDGSETCPRCAGDTQADAVTALPAAVEVGSGAAPAAVLAAPPAATAGTAHTPTTPPSVSRSTPPLPTLTRTSLSRTAERDEAPPEPTPDPAQTLRNRPPVSRAPVTVRDSGADPARTRADGPVARAVAPLAPVVTPPPAQVRPKLVVIRGQRLDAEYPVYEGRNTIGRFADKPVDIDLTAQEPEGQVWSSRLHAAVTFDRGVILVEDLNSLNGTWVNGARLHPGQQRLVQPGDVLQIGTIQLKVVVV